MTPQQPFEPPRADEKVLPADGQRLLEPDTVTLRLNEELRLSGCKTQSDSPRTVPATMVARQVTKVTEPKTQLASVGAARRDAADVVASG